MSGRTLRRLPLLAHARHTARSRDDFTFEEEADDLFEDSDAPYSDYAASTVGEELDSVETWLEAMQHAVVAEQDQMEKVDSQVHVL